MLLLMVFLNNIFAVTVPDRQEGLLLIRHVDEADVLAMDPVGAVHRAGLLEQAPQVLARHLITQLAHEYFHHDRLLL